MDEKTGDVYFQAAKLNAHDRQVYVAHKNGKVERLTDAAGSNSAYRFGRLPLSRQIPGVATAIPYSLHRNAATRQASSRHWKTTSSLPRKDPEV